MDGSHRSRRAGYPGPPDDAPVNAFRRKRLAHAIAAAGVEALVAGGQPNIVYTLGYHSVSQSLFPASQAYAIVRSDGAVVAAVVPYADVPSIVELADADYDLACFGRLYFERGDQTRDPRWERALEVQGTRAFDDPIAALADTLSRHGLARARIGVDESRFTPDRWRALAAALPDATLVPAYEIFRQARRVKGEDEIALLEQAARIAEEALLDAVREARAGMTERELATRYMEGVATRGAAPLFTVVTFGERAALSDTPLSDRPLREGEPMRFDLGVSYRGYPSDIGRTASLGEPSQKLEDLYAALLAGEEALIAAIRPGLSGEGLYEIGMDAVRRRGVPGYRRHHTGHAIGLEPYEPPIVAPGHRDAIEANTTFCLETPYYELGWGGAMVEDLVVVTEGGARIANRTPRTLWRAGVA